MEDKKIAPAEQSIEARIKHWKQTHPHIFCIETTDENGKPIQFYMRKPDMNIMGAFTAMADKNPTGAGIVLFKNCLLNTELDHYADDVDVMSSIMEQMVQMIDRRASSIKKL